MTTLPIDLRAVASRPSRSGWLLRCPGCARWSRTLYVLGCGMLGCRHCRDRSERR
jgi:hypothetical protein